MPARGERSPLKKVAERTRRELLVRLGASTAAAAVSPVMGIASFADSALPADPPEPRSSAATTPRLIEERIPPGPVEIELRINGAARKVTIEPRTTLLSALRNRLDLTGTKEICDRGACGGCTVHVDGRAVNSCLMLALDARGREVRTIEGLAKGSELDPVQRAFIEKDALMCGFCTPGMVMSVRALLDRTPGPTLEDVQRATAGNLCRCGTYPKVFEAALAAAKSQAPSARVPPTRGMPTTAPSTHGPSTRGPSTQAPATRGREK